MRRSLATCVGLAALVWTGDAAAEQARESGGSIYRTYCAGCHGASAKGDGSLADSLRIRPPDLTLIKQRAEGKWSAEDVFKIVDGRKPVKGHGGSEMPIWGDAFKSSREGYSEDAVRERIQALVEHLESIQVKKEAK